MRCNPPARRTGHVTFVQNDLASYNPSSREYLVAAQLIRTQSNIKCKACKVEFFTSILAWLIQHPQLLHQIKGFPDVVEQKIIEIQADLHRLSNEIEHRSGNADFNGIGYNDMELYGVYNKALGYIQIMQMVLDKMAA